jgi:hypothetical protein
VKINQPPVVTHGRTRLGRDVEKEPKTRRSSRVDHALRPSVCIAPSSNKRAPCCRAAPPRSRVLCRVFVSCFVSSIRQTAFLLRFCNVHSVNSFMLLIYIYISLLSVPCFLSAAAAVGTRIGSNLYQPS